MARLPTPKRLLHRIRRRRSGAAESGAPRPVRGRERPTTRLRYAIEDAIYFVGDRISGLRARGRELWFGLPLVVRRRLAAGLGLVAVVAVVWLVLLPAAPCQFPAGDRCPPDDDAVALVPADSLAYLHLDLDTDSEQYERAAELAERLPTLSAALFSTLATGPGGGADFRGQVAPWLEGEAAVAFLPSGRGSAAVRLFEVADEDGAMAFAAERTGSAETGEHRGVEIQEGRDESAALVDGFLVLGESAAVRSVIDVAAGESEALPDSNAGDLLEGLPEPSISRGYLSELGAETLLPGTALATFAALVNPDATTGAGGAVTVTDDGFDLTVSSRLDPERAERAPGFFGSFEPFEPDLAEEAPADSLAFVNIGNPAASAGALLSQAVADAPALVGAFRRLQRDLRREGVNLDRQVLPLLDAETALVLAPAPADDGQAEGEALLPAGPPVVTLVATDVDEEAAREGIAGLQRPIARAVDPGGGQAPVFEELEIGGVTAQALRISPTLELTFAVFDGQLVVASDPEGIADIRGGGDGLAGTEAFEAATAGFGDSSSVLAFGDLTGLVALAEASGLAEDPEYAVLSADIRKLESLGLSITSSVDAIETELRLLVGEGPAEPDVEEDEGLFSPVPE